MSAATDIVIQTMPETCGMLRQMTHGRETPKGRWRSEREQCKTLTVTYSPSFSSSFCLSRAVARLLRSAAAAAVALHRPLQAKERTASPEQRNSPL